MKTIGEDYEGYIGSHKDREYFEKTNGIKLDLHVEIGRKSHDAIDRDAGYVRRQGGEVRFLGYLVPETRPA